MLLQLVSGLLIYTHGRFCRSITSTFEHKKIQVGRNTVIRPQSKVSISANPSRSGSRYNDMAILLRTTYEVLYL
ncbi:hypothetical protein EDB82DRAFT_22437 [Fusarium venenatum]|uniref:uncharacterized protein n=1 Tax=Fusarium venenatum TaxID=56646 RepID=UPI001D5CAE4D|nr:hypothetical protein EDB82DRAFT_22437 [Fusarium venenatum]